MRKVVILFISLFIINVFTIAGYANELIEPQILDNRTNSIVGRKQYFLEENNGKREIIMKDLYDDEIPMISLKEGDNFVSVLPDSENKAKPIQVVEYTKSGLVKFTNGGIKLVDNQGKQISLAYPNGAKFSLQDDDNFDRIIRSVSDGEDVFFIMAGKLYLVSTQNKKMTYLTTLKDFKDDSVYLSVSQSADDDDKLVSISESYGEPHLGFQGHSILIKNNKVMNYWLNGSYGGGGVMPAYLGEDLVAAAQGGQLAIYDLPSFQSKKYSLNMKEPGIIFANHDYVVLSNDKNMIVILDLKTGKMEEPYKTLYNDAQKKIVEGDDNPMVQLGDSLRFVSLNGDELVFHVDNVYRFDPPAGNVYDYTKAPVYQYTYNYQTKEYKFTKLARLASAFDDTNHSPFINAGDLDMTLKESMENLTIYRDDEKICTIPYPRKYLGTCQTGNLHQTFYVENRKNGDKKESILVIKSLNTYPTISDKEEKVKLPADCFNTILKEALAALPKGNNTYLITKNRIYKVSGGKVVKKIGVSNIEYYSTDTDKIYLFDQNNVYVLDTKNDEIKLLGKNEYASARINHLNPVQRNEMTGGMKQIEDAYQKTVQQSEIEAVLFPFAGNYKYAEPVFTDGTKVYCLIMDNAVLNLPESLKNRNAFIYQSTEKEYGFLVKKYSKITVSLEDVDWEYTYQTEYPLVISKTKAKMYYANQEIKSNTYPIMQNGSLLIPMREAAGPMGIDFAFDAKNGLMTLKKDNIIIRMTVNSNKATVNDESVELSSPVILNEGNVMVPLRFISEKFGYKIKLEYDYKNLSTSDGNRISKVLIDQAE